MTGRSFAKEQRRYEGETTRFHQMVLGRLDSHVQKKKGNLDADLTPVTKINSKCIMN